MSGGSAASSSPHPGSGGHKIRVGRASGLRRLTLLRALLLIGVPVAVLVGSIVGYLLVSSPGTACTPILGRSTTPSVPVWFSGVVLQHWNATFSITSAKVCEAPSHYRFSLSVGSSHGDSQSLPPAASPSPVLVNGTPFRVGWVDRTGDGVVDVGDTFQVSGDGVRLLTAPTAGSILEYRFSLLASDGNLLGVAGWTLPYLPPPPVVTFGNLTQVGGNTTIPILTVSQGYDPWNYWVNLAVGLSAGIPTTMPGVSGGPGSRVFVDGILYHIPWIDVDGSGTVSGGDRFLVTGDGTGLPSSTGFTFDLIWTDESLVRAVSWTT